MVVDNGKEDMEATGGADGVCGHGAKRFALHLLPSCSYFRHVGTVEPTRTIF
jgi:hypothetical protein